MGVARVLPRDKFSGPSVETSNVYLTGAPRRMRSNESTGKMTFNQRKQLAYKTNGKPLDAKVPAFVNKV